MNRLFGITKENSEELGFVITSLFCSAINLDELHEWCYEIIRETDIQKLPPYIMELANFEEKLAKIFNVIGFVPTWKHDDLDEAALCGIAMSRGVRRVEWPFSEEVARAALNDRQAILQRFRETFNFLSL
jgi:hypothetical protein